MISLVDFKKENQEVGDEIRTAFSRIQDRGWYVLGDELSKFEEEYARYIGTSCCIGVNSGSDALILALKAIGIGPGDEVILPSHTFIATADAVVRNGAVPVFADIDPQTYCLDPTTVEGMITPRTRALIPVHIYGHPADMAPLQELASEYALPIVEDACQAHGSEYMAKKAGSIGLIGCFSFYPGKNLGAYGDAGCIVTNDQQIDERIRMLRNYGQRKKYEHICIGMNSRMDEIQAAVLRVKLQYLDQWNERRRYFSGLYDEFLHGNDLIGPIERSYARHVFHQYVIRVKNRDRLFRYLRDHAIETGIHYPIPVHQQPAYKRIGLNSGLPTTEMIAKEILSLPIHPYMDENSLAYVVETIQKCL